MEKTPLANYHEEGKISRFGKPCLPSRWGGLSAGEKTREKRTTVGLGEMALPREEKGPGSGGFLSCEGAQAADVANW